MLVKLRRRFILITMGLVGLVLLVVLAASVVSSYQATAARIELATGQALSSGPNNAQRPWIGGWSLGQPPITMSPEIQEQDSGFPQRSTRASDPFTPVYVMIVDQSSFAILGDNSAFVTIDSSLANTALTRIKDKLSQGRATEGNGFTGMFLDIRLFYRVETTGGTGTSGGSAGTGSGNGIATIALADASSLIDNTLQMTGVSALIWIGAMVVLFFVSLLLSRMALRPAADAWERQRRFVADASHELKTPLTVILANNSLLLSHPHQTITEQRQWVDSTQAEAQRMDNLVHDLLLLAQTDKEEARPKHSSSSSAPLLVDLSALTRHNLLQFEAVFFERGVYLEANVADGISIPGNKEQLERLVQILLDNASKYAKAPAPISTAAPVLVPAAVAAPPPTATATPAPATTPAATTTVRVTLRPYATTGPNSGIGAYSKPGTGAKRHATLMIANTGDAIAPEDLPRLFERFYRTDSARSDTEGSGLGLSLAQAIIEAHHGSIRVTSDPVNGTIFTVIL
jgi:signal transduction histidine kinase